MYSTSISCDKIVKFLFLMKLMIFNIKRCDRFACMIKN